MVTIPNNHLILKFIYFLRLIYCFTRDFSYENAAHELCDFTSEQPVVIPYATIAAGYQYCRELIIDRVSQIQSGKPKLGGISESGSPIVVQVPCILAYF